MGNNIRRSIVVKLDVEGLHQWAGCNIEEVQYLANLHRHTFQILCEIQVGHGDRDVEFIEFKHRVKKYLQDRWYKVQYDCCYFGSMSCEQIAEVLMEEFSLSKCSVGEDGEFWGVVEMVQQ